MGNEPLPSRSGNVLKGTWLMEQMRCAAHDVDLARRAEPSGSFLVDSQVGLVIAADHEQHRGLDAP
ncbi:hypothetical protein ABT032_44450 [Streptomyces flaveus]